MYSIPQIFTVYQTLAVFLLAIFSGEFFFVAFLGVNSTFCQMEGQFYFDQDSLK